MRPNRRFRVLLDVDGVLCDFAGPALDAVESVCGRRPDPGCWEIGAALTPEQVNAYYNRLHAAGWVASLPPLPGAAEAVEALRKLGDVYFVTAPLRGPTWAHERTEWLIEHVGASRREVVITSSKHVVDGDVLIDDKQANLNDWLARNAPALGGLGLLWGQPYNRANNTRLTRVESWTDALSRVRAYAERMGWAP